MKIRNDFVSNSSSCSFILEFKPGFDFSKIDDKFFKLCSLAKYITFEDLNKIYSVDEYKDKLNKLDKEKYKIDEVDLKYLDEYNNITIHFNFTSNENFIFDFDSKDVFMFLLENCSSLYFYMGEDDYGIEAEVAQIATIFELLYNVKITGDDHFTYNSIDKFKKYGINF